MMMMNKMYTAATAALLSAVLLMVAVPGLANASTTSYETYTNQDYDFSIDYPSDWKEQETNLQQFGAVKFLAPDDTPGGIDISIMKVDPDMSLYEIATLNDESKTRQINMTNTTLTGFPAVEKIYYQYELAGVAKIKEALILNENNLDLISIRYVIEPGNFEYLPAFDYMLKSFKVGLNE